MKEIGGFFELECAHNAPYHANAEYLNSARNALRYIVRAYKIRQMFVPFYTCSVVWEALLKEKVSLRFYALDEGWLPAQTFEKDAFILYNNYFGVCGKNVELLAKRYPNLIVDNAQAFYAPPRGLAAFYSPRKFFGLPDGGLAISPRRIDLEHSARDCSFARCAHLLKRYDKGASAAYALFSRNDEKLRHLPLRPMSYLTQALMSNINYDFVRQRRLENFAFLHNALKKQNKIDLHLDKTDVPMVYPFVCEDTTLRARLIKQKIYVARYWPEIENQANIDPMSLYLQQHLVPLPIDQRYDISDMKRILEVIK